MQNVQCKNTNVITLVMLHWQSHMYFTLLSIYWHSYIGNLICILHCYPCIGIIILYIIGAFGIMTEIVIGTLHYFGSIIDKIKHPAQSKCSINCILSLQQTTTPLMPLISFLLYYPIWYYPIWF